MHYDTSGLFIYIAIKDGNRNSELHTSPFHRLDEQHQYGRVGLEARVVGAVNHTWYPVSFMFLRSMTAPVRPRFGLVLQTWNLQLPGNRLRISAPMGSTCRHMLP